MNHLLKTAIYLFACMTLCSCADEDPPCIDPINPQCPNYNPCLAFQPANADFVIMDSIYGVDCNDSRGRLDLVTEVGTNYTNSDLYFRALHHADTYQWQVGTHPVVFDKKAFTLYFPNSIAPADIVVTLIACKQGPDTCQFAVCDTLSKKIHLFFTAGNDTSSLVIGRFKGSNTDTPLDSFIIEIPPPLPSLIGIINFPNGCEGQYLNVMIGRKGFILHQTPTVCQSACGIGQIQPDRKTLVIDYSISSASGRVLKKFIGRKIP